jgi:type IV secretory pathway TrbD component
MREEETASRSAIHQSLTRPLLLAGAERAPAIANWIMAAAIFFGGGLHWYTIVISVLLVTVGHWALVQAAKFDPQLTRVYARHIRYRNCYPATASIWAPPLRVQPSVPNPREMRG